MNLRTITENVRNSFWEYYQIFVTIPSLRMIQKISRHNMDYFGNVLKNVEKPQFSILYYELFGPTETICGVFKGFLLNQSVSVHLVIFSNNFGNVTKYHDQIGNIPRKPGHYIQIPSRKCSSFILGILPNICDFSQLKNIFKISGHNIDSFGNVPKNVKTSTITLNTIL